MKATQKLHELGQSIWLDNITRDLLTSGTLKRYIDELSLTGLTSNPTIFDQAIKSSSAYDSAIRAKLAPGTTLNRSGAASRTGSSRLRAPNQTTAAPPSPSNSTPVRRPKRHRRLIANPTVHADDSPSRT